MNIEKKLLRLEKSNSIMNIRNPYCKRRLPISQFLSNFLDAVVKPIRSLSTVKLLPRRPSRPYI